MDQAAITSDLKQHENGEKGYKSLCRILAARDHSELELETKLGEKYEDILVQKLIAFAKTSGWLSDPEALAQRVSEDLQRRGKGALYVARVLQEKGLPEISFPEIEETHRATELAESRFGSPESWDPKIQGKVARFLMQRGFAPEISQSVALSSGPQNSI